MALEVIMLGTYDILLTGATGFVGSHLLHDLLAQTDKRVLVLVRGERARSRVLDALQTAGASRLAPPLQRDQLDRFTVVAGDITDGCCGLDVSLRARLRGRVRQIWHAAASLKFEDRHRDEIRRVNVGGTANVLDLAEGLGVERMVYVSTAYVCGPREGDIPELLFDPDGPFNNEYERSKCVAEHLVANRAAVGGGMQMRIVRPSIVVGPRQSYAPGGSDSGLYGFVREVRRVRNTLAAMNTALVLHGDAAAPLNFVPVDEVSAAILRLDREGFTGGLIHHLTSDVCPDVATTLAAIARLCGVAPIVAQAERGRPATPVERVLDQRARFYRSYLSGHKRFRRASGKPIEVSGAELSHYVAQYLRRVRAAAADQVFRCETLTTDDGARLETFSCGESGRPALLVVNAFGMPMDFWVPLAESVRSELRVIGWNLRGTGTSDGSTDLGIEAQLRDVTRVMEHFGIRRACLVGWCTGADMAAEFARRYPHRVTGSVLVNGAFCNVCGPTTPFQDQLQRTLCAAAESPEHAQLYHELIYKASVQSMLAIDLNDEREALTSILSMIDADAMDLASLPFRSGEHLYRYAQVMMHYRSWAETVGPLQTARVPTLVIASGRDHVIDASVAPRVAKRLGGELWTTADGTHFAHFDRRDVMQAIGDFAKKHGSGLRTIQRLSHASFDGSDCTGLRVTRIDNQLMSAGE
jgi:nucleoside-diphosphate-sugar epimerase/pimeloyl-ACP methyl ester carboxylesterase